MKQAAVEFFFVTFIGTLVSLLCYASYLIAIREPLFGYCLAIGVTLATFNQMKKWIVG